MANWENQVAPVAQSVSAPYLYTVNGARNAEVVSSNLTWSILIAQSSLTLSNVSFHYYVSVRMAEWSKAPDSR